jgi:hypothetical protein
MLKKWQLVIEKDLEILMFLEIFATEISINTILSTQLFREGGETWKRQGVNLLN